MNSEKDNNLDIKSKEVQKEERLKTFLKNSVRQALIATGRKLVVEKGPDFLTARKLSEASKCSIGTIYNQFGNMDCFIAEQNLLMVQELLALMESLILEPSAYVNLNRYVDVFVNYVMANPNLWSLLFAYHLHSREGLPKEYLRIIRKVSQLCEVQVAATFPNLSRQEKKLAWQVLMTVLFSLSAFLTNPGLDKLGNVTRMNVCKLLLNTYLAGLSALKRG